MCAHTIQRLDRVRRDVFDSCGGPSFKLGTNGDQ